MPVTRQEAELRIRTALEGLSDLQKLNQTLDLTSREAQELQKEGNELFNGLQKLGNQQALLNSFRELKRTIPDVTQAFEQQQRVATQYGRQAAQTSQQLDLIRLQQSQLADAATRSQAALNSQRAELAALNQTINQAGGATAEQASQVRRLTREIERNERAIDDNQREQEALRRTYEQTSTTLKEQQRAFNDARGAANRLNQEQLRQRQTLQAVRAELQQYLQSGERLAGLQVRIRREFQSTQQRADALANSISRLSRQQSVIKDPTGPARQGFGILNNQIQSLNLLVGSLSLGAGLLGLTRLGNASIKAAAGFENLQRAINTVTNQDSARTQTLFNELIGEANRLGVGITNLSRPFVEFQLATQAVNLEASQATRLFGLFTESLLRAGGSIQEIQETQLGLVQSIRQGNIQFDEFRQIASRLPGAFDAVRKAFDLTTESVKDFISTGKAIFDERSLSVFVEELANSLNATGQAIDGITAAQGRASGSLQRLGDSFARNTGLAELYREALEGISDQADKMATDFEEFGRTSEQVTAILAADFTDTQAILAAARGEIEKANEALSETGRTANEIRLSEISTRINQLTREYDDLGLKSKASLTNMFDNTQNASRAAAQLRVRIAELRQEQERLNAEATLSNAFDNGKVESYTAVIQDLRQALKNLEGDSSGVDAIIGQLRRQLQDLSEEELAAFREELIAFGNSQQQIGEDTATLTQLMQALADEGLRRAKAEFTEMTGALKDNTDAIQKNADLTQRKIEQADALAAANVRTAETERDIAAARLEEAEAAEQANRNALTELDTKRAIIRLAERELQLAQAQAAAARQAVATAQARVQALAAERAQLLAVVESIESQVEAGQQLNREDQKRVDSIRRTIEQLQLQIEVQEADINVKQRQAQAASEVASASENALERIKKAQADIGGSIEDSTKAQEGSTKAAKDTEKAVADLGATTGQAASLTQLMADALAAARAEAEGLSPEALVEFDKTLQRLNERDVGLWAAQFGQAAQAVENDAEAASKKIAGLQAELRELAIRRIALPPLSVGRFLNSLAEASALTKIQFAEAEQAVAGFSTAISRITNNSNLDALENELDRVTRSTKILGQQRLDALRNEFEDVAGAVRRTREEVERLRAELEQDIARLRGDDQRAARLEEEENHRERVKEIEELTDGNTALYRELISQENIRHRLALENARTEQRARENTDFVNIQKAAAKEVADEQIRQLERVAAARTAGQPGTAGSQGAGNGINDSPGSLSPTGQFITFGMFAQFIQSQQEQTDDTIRAIGKLGQSIENQQPTFIIRDTDLIQHRLAPQLTTNITEEQARQARLRQ